VLDLSSEHSKANSNTVQTGISIFNMEFHSTGAARKPEIPMLKYRDSGFAPVVCRQLNVYSNSHSTAGLVDFLIQLIICINVSYYRLTLYLW